MIRMDVTMCTDIEGTEKSLKVPGVFLTRVENGYLYIFECIGDNDEDIHKEFEDLLKSAVYTKESKPNLLEELVLLNSARSVVLMLVICFIPMAVYRFALKKQAVKLFAAIPGSVLYSVILHAALAAYVVSADGAVYAAAAGLTVRSVLAAAVNVGILAADKKKEDTFE